VICDLFISGTNSPLPSPPFTSYGTSGIFTVFTSNANYDKFIYPIDVRCNSILSKQGEIVSKFTISFVHDTSSSNTAVYSGCANDNIYWNSKLKDFDLPVSAFPPDVVYTPLIQQQVPGCPI